MSMKEAAERSGLSEESVRRWVDEHEQPGREPVAERQRDAQGVPVPGSWRRPYVDAVEEWIESRRRAPTSPATPPADSGAWP